MDFLALDVETANADLPSICQIGVAHFSDGKLANEWQSYVDPQGYFDPINVSIHGIDERKTAGAPRFGQLLPILRPLVENQVVVTALVHLAGFGVRCPSGLV